MNISEIIRTRVVTRRQILKTKVSDRQKFRAVWCCFENFVLRSRKILWIPDFFLKFRKDFLEKGIKSRINPFWAISKIWCVYLQNWNYLWKNRSKFLRLISNPLHLPVMTCHFQFLTSSITPFHTLWNIPAPLLKNTLHLLIRAGIFHIVWKGDRF